MGRPGGGGPPDRCAYARRAGRDGCAARLGRGPAGGRVDRRRHRDLARGGASPPLRGAVATRSDHGHGPAARRTRRAAHRRRHRAPHLGRMRGPGPPAPAGSRGACGRPHRDGRHGAARGCGPGDALPRARRTERLALRAATRDRVTGPVALRAARRSGGGAGAGPAPRYPASAAHRVRRRRPGPLAGHLRIARRHRGRLGDPPAALGRRAAAGVATRHGGHLAVRGAVGVPGTGHARRGLSHHLRAQPWAATSPTPLCGAGGGGSRGARRGAALGDGRRRLALGRGGLGHGLGHPTPPACAQAPVASAAGRGLDGRGVGHGSDHRLRVRDRGADRGGVESGSHPGGRYRRARRVGESDRWWRVRRRCRAGVGRPGARRRGGGRGPVRGGIWWGPRVRASPRPGCSG